MDEIPHEDKCSEESLVTKKDKIKSFWQTVQQVHRAHDIKTRNAEDRLKRMLLFLSPNSNSSGNGIILFSCQGKKK